MSDYLLKLESHRKAIREHIDKYYSYPYPQDKEYALKTILRIQEEIRYILSKKPNLGSSWEDIWTP